MGSSGKDLQEQWCCICGQQVTAQHIFWLLRRQGACSSTEAVGTLDAFGPILHDMMNGEIRRSQLAWHQEVDCVRPVMMYKFKNTSHS